MFALLRCKQSNWKGSGRKILKPVIPVGIFLGMIYLSWIYAQHICWYEVYRHHSRSTAIGLIVGNCLLVLLLFFIWMQLFALGPGVQPKIPVFMLIKDESADYKSVEPPEYFYSDINGLPIWCSTCQSIKANRTHHSSDMNSCVARFDHYCSWIGSSVGRRNYRLFVQFMFWYLLYFIYIGISSAVYIKQIRERNDSVNGNLIVLFVAVVFWLIMIFALFTSHIFYISRNISAIDDILNKRHRKNNIINDHFINLKYGDQRYVLRINPEMDLIWNKGFVRNWKEAMGENPLFWVIPWMSNIVNTGDENGTSYEEILGDYTEVMDEKWIGILQKRVTKGDYLS